MMYLVKIYVPDSYDGESEVGPDLAIIESDTMLQMTQFLNALYPDLPKEKIKIRELASMPERVNAGGIIYYPLGILLNVDE